MIRRFALGGLVVFVILFLQAYVRESDAFYSIEEMQIEK